MLRLLVSLLFISLLSLTPAHAQSTDRRSPTLLEAPVIQGYSEKQEKKYYYVTKPIEGKWKFSGYIKADEGASVHYMGIRVKCSQLDGKPLGGMLHVHGNQDYKEYSILVPKKQPIVVELSPAGPGEYEVKFWPNQG